MGHDDVVIDTLLQLANDVVESSLSKFRCHDGKTLLHRAAEIGNLHAVQIYSDFFDVEVVDNDGNTPLHLACDRGFLNIVQFLIEKHNVNLNGKNYFGCTPLHLSSLGGRLDVTEYLIKQSGVSINEQDTINYTPLHYACAGGNIEVVLHLLSNGADPFIGNRLSDDLVYPEHFAIKHEHNEVAMLLYQFKEEWQAIKIKSENNKVKKMKRHVKIFFKKSKKQNLSEKTTNARQPDYSENVSTMVHGQAPVNIVPYQHVSRHPLFATSKSNQQLMSLLQNGEPRPLPALPIPPITLDEHEYLVPPSFLPTRRIHLKKIHHQQYPPLPPPPYFETKQFATSQQQTPPPNPLPLSPLRQYAPSQYLTPQTTIGCRPMLPLPRNNLASILTRVKIPPLTRRPLSPLSPTDDEENPYENPEDMLAQLSQPQTLVQNSPLLPRQLPHLPPIDDEENLYEHLEEMLAQLSQPQTLVQNSSLLRRPQPSLPPTDDVENIYDNAAEVLAELSQRQLSPGASDDSNDIFSTTVEDDDDNTADTNRSTLASRSSEDIVNNLSASHSIANNIYAEISTAADVADEVVRADENEDIIEIQQHFVAPLAIEEAEEAFELSGAVEGPRVNENQHLLEVAASADDGAEFSNPHPESHEDDDDGNENGPVQETAVNDRQSYWSYGNENLYSAYTATHSRSNTGGRYGRTSDNFFGRYSWSSGYYSSIFDQFYAASHGTAEILPSSIGEYFEEFSSNLANQHLLDQALFMTSSQIINSSSSERRLLLQRNNVLNDMFEAYQHGGDLLPSQRIVVEYVGEQGIDAGGLTRDAFTTFWSQLFDLYFQGEDAKVPRMSSNVCGDYAVRWKLVGTILSHYVAHTTTLPVKFCRSTLAYMNDTHTAIPDEVLLNDFLLYLVPSKRELVKQALQDFVSLTEEQREELIDLFSHYEHRESPNALTIKSQIIELATRELLVKPSYICNLIKSGIPEEYQRSFWQRLHIQNLTLMYNSCIPTTAKVVQCLKTNEEDAHCPEKMTIFCFLQRFVNSLNRELLERFLHYVTGTNLLSTQSITVTFSAASGLARRPIVHTCSNTLELSTDYDAFSEFHFEFITVLSDDRSFEMTAI